MTKVDIISGFLGAGKTTFIKKLISDVYPGEQIVLIENEFGEIGIDGTFMNNAGIEVTEINSGCICCSLVGDFEASLKEVLETYHPDRIIIEPSGVGKLSDVIKAVSDVHSHELELDNYIAVIDAKKCRLYTKNFGEFFNNQIEYASLIILSRTQDITEFQLDECLKIIKEHNNQANVITTPWDQLTKEILINAFSNSDNLRDELLEQLDICPICAHHHDHHHNHEHHHDHEHHHHEHHHHEHHHHVHRNLFDVNKIIDDSGINERAKALAKRIFLRVALAESKVHNEELANVHFHEVGAIDSIVDIIGTAILITKIAPDKIYSSIVNDGHGFIECAHGTISVPVPATSEIFAASNVVARQIDIDTELVTPTGAAIIAELSSSFQPMPPMNVQKIGWGCGTKELNIPNVLKVSLGTIDKTNDEIIVMETNIDDCSSEILAYTAEKLFENTREAGGK